MVLSRFLVLCLLPLLVLCVEDYYKLLGIDRQATDKEIKKAYRLLSKKYHPDKNPNDEDAKQKFVDIADAYDVLSDSETRKIFDQYGHEGVERHKKQKSGPGGGSNPFDLFSRFFGGGGHFGGGERRGPNMEVQLAIPLTDFYTGNEMNFNVEKQSICDKCEGTGSQDGKKETCGKCSGHGVVVQKIMLAPGIYQQVQQACDACGGAGKVIRHPCKVCGGHRVVRSTETHTVHIQRGMPKGVKITYDNEADENPDYVAGDLIVQLVEKEPAMAKDARQRTDGIYFRRKGDDLFWREVLSLREAWMGDWSRNVTHLDGHVVRLARNRGETVQPNHVEVVHGEGMPLYREGDHDESTRTKKEYGALYVEYVVVLPDQMDSGMEKDFWSLWDKWRKKKGVNLEADIGRPMVARKDEL